MSDLDDLRAELDDFAQPAKKGGKSALEERVIAGFEEIQRFVDQHGRAPQHGEDKDIFERIYAVRLDQVRAQELCRSIVLPIDHQGLLNGVYLSQTATVMPLDDDELLAELEGVGAKSGLSELRHVRSTAEIKAAEEIANREVMRLIQLRTRFLSKRSAVQLHA